MAEAVVGVGEEVPLDELAVGDEALPERALDGGRRDVVQARAEDQRGALERLGQLEGVAGPVRGLGLVADGRVVEHDGLHGRVIGRERDQEPPAHAVADAAGARGIGVHAVDQIAPGLVHLAQELLVAVLGLQIGAGADVVGARDAEHVEEIGREHVEAQAGQPVGVDLVVGGDPVGVVHHQDAGPLAGALGMRHVAGDAVLLLRDHACDDVHVPSLIETAGV